MDEREGWYVSFEPTEPFMHKAIPPPCIYVVDLLDASISQKFAPHTTYCTYRSFHRADETRMCKNLRQIFLQAGKKKRWHIYMHRCSSKT